MSTREGFPSSGGKRRSEVVWMRTRGAPLPGQGPFKAIFRGFRHEARFQCRGTTWFPFYTRESFSNLSVR